MRSISQVSLAAVAAATCVIVAAPAQAQEQQHSFNVAAQPASSGVVTFAQQAGIQILAPGDATAGKRVSSVRGDYTVREGLHRLLVRTGLHVASFDGRTAVLTADPTASRTTSVAPDAATATPVADTQTTPAEPPAAAPAGDDNSMQEIVVTGSTSGKRTLFDESSDVTLANAADIQRKAPRSTAEALELVPGIFVEGTAGAVSNNYSVRGLRGGAQTFIQLEEDGLPIIYGGGGADEYFQNDITIDRLESVEGGTSGILAVNGAAATINFISKTPNFDHVTSMVRFTGSSYGLGRADAYFSAPIADNLAFNVGGYVASDPGFRSSSFRYRTYHIKGMLEYRFGSGGYARLTLKSGNQHDAYYADMPFRSDPTTGKISDVPGLDGSHDNIAGRAFANIGQPDSCFTGTCVRNFSLNQGIHTTTTQYRGDIEAPLNDSVKLFAHARYLRATFDFNGIFPGSNGQPPASAVTYLTPGVSPISSLLTAGLAAFPGTTHFGIRNTLSGVVTPSTDTATLDALNGNGLLQETVLNHQTTKTRDFGSNFGVTWDTTGSTIDNSLTVGGMYYNVRHRDNQSAVSTVINDVTNNSAIYDVVALDAANNVLGQLTNNGQISYGNWGQGIFHDHIDSLSGYFNDELKIGEKLHVDFGLRYEHEHDAVDFGHQGPDGTVQPGTPGIVTDLGATFDGTYVHKEVSYNHLAWTAGVNYTLTDNLAFYARYARGFQTNGGNSGGPASKPSNLTLYEAGARLQTGFIVGSLVAFRTEFRNQFYTFTNPDNPAIQNSAQADDNINGIQLDMDLNPADFFTLSVSGVYQDPKLVNLRFNGAPQPGFDGNTPERTPKELLTVTPAFILPGGLGEIYGRYKYIGKIFADAGNGVALPAYGVFTIGAMINLSDRVNLNVSVDNLTNVDGYTEGNPRQGQTQSIVNGYFYGRSIVGRNALASVTFKF